MSPAKAPLLEKGTTGDKITGDGTHVAIARGFSGVEIIEIGQNVTAGIPVGSWMVPVSKQAPASED